MGQSFHCGVSRILVHVRAERIKCLRSLALTLLQADSMHSLLYKRRGKTMSRGASNRNSMICGA